MILSEVKTDLSHEECKGKMRPILDTMEVLSGRWKMPILLSLIMGTKRFKQISKDVVGISDKVLSKELKDLELNQLIKREVYDTFPPTVEYSITPHGNSLQKLILELGTWGAEHRKKVIGK